MKTVSLVCTAVLIIACQSFAQVVVEEEITTDSVDLFSYVDTSSRSVSRALAATLILPGSGHYYLGRRDVAMAYFATEILAAFGFYYAEQYSRTLAGNAAQYAMIYAGAAGGAGADENYWQAVGRYLDYEGYNRVQTLNRTEEKLYTSENLRWSWYPGAHQDNYNSIREDSRRFQVAATFFAGALVLDRVFSFIELRASTRNKGIKHISVLPQLPSLLSRSEQYGLKISAFF